MSEKIVPSSSPELIQKIEGGSKRVNDLATKLSDRILAFEQWLSGLKGRVETELWESEDQFSYFVLRLHRSGKQWIISHAWVHQQQMAMEDPPDWTPLKDSPVEIKLRAVSLFPKLLERIVKAQDELVEKLTNV